MKFSDYLASYITPQMTLLEKFNALLKYLEEKPELYIHRLSVLPSGATYPFEFSFIDTTNKEYSINDMKVNGFFGHKIFEGLKSADGAIIVKVEYRGTGNYLILKTGTEVALIPSTTVISSKCEIYED